MEKRIPLETTLISRQTEIESWFRRKWMNTPPPFYGSVDLRNSGFKIAPVDTNLFPSGFNNLNPAFMPLYIQSTQHALEKISPSIERILIVPESHTRNQTYFENLAVLQKILESAGFEVKIGSLREDLTVEQSYSLMSGEKLTIYPLERQKDQLLIGDFIPSLVILNNDLSSGVPEILEHISQPIMPSIGLGWFKRLKSEHFRYYHEVIKEFAEAFSIDPWLLMPLFEHCEEIDFQERKGLECLVANAEDLLSLIREKYKQYEVDRPPFLVVKADTGTYGMAVLTIRKPEELYHLNRKQKNKMAKTKGNQSVTKAILQEGIYSIETIGEPKATAEPVIYLIGEQIMGGFYRTNKLKGSDENLNAPGMHFHPFDCSGSCQAVQCSSGSGGERFYAYGVIARLAFLAAAYELINLERK